MNTFFKVTSLGLLTLGLTVSCGSSKQAPKTEQKKETQPSWVMNPEQQYPKLTHLTYVGESPYKQVAENNAKKGLTQVFSTRVQSVDDSKETVKETQTSFSKVYESVTNIKISSDVEIENLKLSGTYFDKAQQKYYVLATVDKQETANIYQSKVDKLTREVNTFLDVAMKTDKKLEKLASISQALNNYREIENRMDILRVLEGGMTQNPSLPKNKGELWKMQQDILSSLKLFVEPTDNKQLDQVVQKELNALGFQLSKSKEGAEIAILPSLNHQKSAVQNKDAALINWQVNIKIDDLKEGKQIKSYLGKGRSSQLNHAAALERMYFDVEKKLKVDFTSYLIKELLNVN